MTLKQRPRSVAAGLLLLLVVIALGVAASARGDRLFYRVERLEPVSVEVNTPSGVADPLVLTVMVAWDEDDYCSGQLRPVVTETATEIVVETVENWEYLLPGSGCAGLGSANGQAWASATLREPPGQRTVRRGSDGAVLPVAAR